MQRTLLHDCPLQRDRAFPGLYFIPKAFFSVDIMPYFRCKSFLPSLCWRIMVWLQRTSAQLLTIATTPKLRMNSCMHTLLLILGSVNTCSRTDLTIADPYNASRAYQIPAQWFWSCSKPRYGWDILNIRTTHRFQVKNCLQLAEVRGSKAARRSTVAKVLKT